jgi:hypothetical protein
MKYKKTRIGSANFGKARNKFSLLSISQRQTAKSNAEDE